jgi:hypothetical protein
VNQPNKSRPELKHTRPFDLAMETFSDLLEQLGVTATRLKRGMAL